MIKTETLKPWILKTINDCGFKKMTDIQEKTLPLTLAGKNVIGVSSTGSGKTLAFLIPALNKIELNQDLQCIILTPTRELARQISSNIELFKKNEKKIKSQLLIGGNDLQKQVTNLNRIKPQIIISTIQRFEEVLINKAINITKINTLILDEADMLMDLGFMSKIEKIILDIDNNNIQKMGWSATLHELLSIRLSKIFKDTSIITVGNSIYENEKIKHSIIHNSDPLKTLDIIINNTNPYLCLIFCNTIKEVKEVYEFLLKKNKSVIMLHGGLSSRERKNNYKSIKQLNYQYVVASDLASRGLDIDGASHVISWNLPKELEWYVHRSGRCGRSKYTGESIVIYNKKDDAKIISLQKKGITFDHVTIKNDNLVSKKFQPKVFKLQFDKKVNDEIKKVLNKKTKVKPGYKKKKENQIQKIKQKSKRRHIEESVNKNRIKEYKKANSKNDLNDDFL